MTPNPNHPSAAFQTNFYASTFHECDVIDSCWRQAGLSFAWIPGPMKDHTWPGVRVRHVATKRSFAETVGVAGGSFVAPAGPHPLGQLRSVVIAPNRQFRWPLHSVFCR